MNSVDLLSLWTNLLPIANLIFAIVFVVVIYSTAAGQGLSNYSVKKILPRLIIVAIGVNVSYYLCAFVVDIINIVSVGLPSLIFGDISSSSDFASVGREIQGLLGGILGVVLFLSFMSVALVAMLVTIIALVARQVILSALVIISPVAIVCAVLPSTQKWFDKWLKTFVQLLAVYPMFMLVWAACRWFQANGNEGMMDAADISTKVILFVVQAVCTIIPAVAIYPLMKSSSGVMGKIAGALDKSPLGTQGNLGKRAQSRDASRRMGIGNTIRNVPQRSADNLSAERDALVAEANEANKHERERIVMGNYESSNVVDSDGNFIEGNSAGVTLGQYQSSIKRARQQDEAEAIEAVGGDAYKQRVNELNSAITKRQRSANWWNSLGRGAAARKSRNQQTHDDLERRAQREIQTDPDFARRGGASAEQQTMLRAQAEQAAAKAANENQQAVEILLSARLAGSTSLQSDIEKELTQAIRTGDSTMAVAAANLLQKNLGNGGGAKSLNDIADRMDNGSLSQTSVQALRAAQVDSNLAAAVNERNPLRAMAAQNNMTIEDFLNTPQLRANFVGRMQGATGSDIAGYKAEFIRMLKERGLVNNLRPEMIQSAIDKQTREGIGDLDSHNELISILGTNTQQPSA